MRRPRRCRRPHQQGRHQQRHRPHTRTNPGRQYGPHPRQAACSIGVKFCAAAPTLFAPREVCASAVKTADPAKANAIARVSVTLRICFSPLVAARCPACSSRNGFILLARRFGSTSTIAGMCVSAEIDRPPGQHCRVGHARLAASRPAKKREAPAVVGPGLSCADVSPRFWQIVMPARYRDRRAFGNSLESERTLV
jgi:hypothetical protein